MSAELDAIADVVERLQRRRHPAAGPLLDRLIDAVGAELAKVDPVTAAMIELDRELDRLALIRLAAANVGVRVERP